MGKFSLYLNLNRLRLNINFNLNRLFSASSTSTATSTGRGSGGHPPSGPVEQPEPEAPASEEAERLKRQAPRLDDINIDIKAEDNSRHGHSGGEEEQRLKRQAPTRLDDINIKVNAVDNSRHGSGAGHGGAAGGQEEPEGEEAGRLARRG
ncbi:hypothetical protein AAVH_10372 [Aphelenchoides avenae]|nr:hypothetical protein AAVH_10372 [Aphelenchus avenae]